MFHKSISNNVMKRFFKSALIITVVLALAGCLPGAKGVKPLLTEGDEIADKPKELAFNLFSPPFTSSVKNFTSQRIDRGVYITDFGFPYGKTRTTLKKLGIDRNGAEFFIAQNEKYYETNSPLVFYTLVSFDHGNLIVVSGYGEFGGLLDTDAKLTKLAGRTANSDKLHSIASEQQLIDFFGYLNYEIVNNTSLDGIDIVLYEY